MTLSDQELTLFALREAQHIPADYVQPGARDSENTLQQLLEVLDRSDVVEAMDRLESETGLRLARREVLPPVWTG
jgi:hypothetical protein